MIKHKILLTGAAGRLGSALRKLDGNQFGADVEWVLVDTKTKDDPAIRAGSFMDDALLDELLPGCTAVIHTAAMHGSFRKTHTPTQFTEVNVVGLVTMLEACKRHNVNRFVFSSTMEVQIGRNWAASGMAVLDERTPPNPDWIYPANKLMCEQLGEYYYRRFGIEFIALRYMGFDWSTELGVSFLARSVMPLDVAAANMLAATKPGLGYEVLNIGTETPLTNNDIVQAANDPFGVVEKHWPGSAELLRAKGDSLPYEEFWPVTRIDKAKQVLGWRPEYTFEKYLKSLGWKPAA